MDACFGGKDVWPRRHRRAARAARRHEFLQRLHDAERRVRRHAEEPFQSHHGTLDASGINKPLDLDPPDFDIHQVAIQRRQRPLCRTRTHQLQLIRRGGEHLVEDRKLAAGGRGVAVRRRNVAGELPVKIRFLELGHAQFGLCHRDTRPAAEQLERPLDPDLRRSIGAARLLSPFHRERGIGAQTCLHPVRTAGVDVSPGRARRRLARQRECDRLLEADAFGKRQVLTSRRRRETQRERHRGSLELHCTVPSKLTDPWPAGPFQSTFISHAPAILKSAFTL